MTTIAERHVTLMLKRAPDARRVRYASTVAFGVIDTSDETVDDGNGVGIRKRLTVVTVPTDAFPTLSEGDALTVYASKLPTSTSTTYTVRDKLLVEDGLMVKYRVVPA